MGDHKGGAGRQSLARRFTDDNGLDITNAPESGLPLSERPAALLAEIERMRTSGIYEPGVGILGSTTKGTMRRDSHMTAAKVNKIALVGKTLLPKGSRPRLVAIDPDHWELRGQGGIVYATGNVSGLRKYAVAVGAPVGLMLNMRGVSEGNPNPIPDVFHGVRPRRSMFVPGTPGTERLKG